MQHDLRDFDPKYIYAHLCEKSKVIPRVKNIFKFSRPCQQENEMAKRQTTVIIQGSIRLGNLRQHSA